MAGSMGRRKFLAGSAAAAGATVLGCKSASRSGSGDRKAREFYELRTYQIPNPEKKAIVDRYLETALVPALNRNSIDRVGVFVAMEDPADHSITVLIPYPTLGHFEGITSALLADADYVAASREMFDRPKRDPAYSRINSRLMQAFKSMPVIEMPAETAARKPRMFEIRTYESHTMEMTALKVEMFDKGETQLMRDVKMGPVFFGETLIGDNVPNLTYMLSAADMDAHLAHWKAFKVSPVWVLMKKIARYKGSLTKIIKSFVVPTAYSQI